MKRAMWVGLLSLWAVGCARHGLTDAQLGEVVKREQKSLDRCYDAALRKSRVKDKLEARALITVDASGHVSGVDIEGELPLEGLPDCLRVAIRAWSFPKAERETKTVLPLRFEPRVEQVPAGRLKP